jgi:hypothetical protein
MYNYIATKIHHRDSIKELIGNTKGAAYNTNNFYWQVQLKYYYVQHEGSGF